MFESVVGGRRTMAGARTRTVYTVHLRSLPLRCRAQKAIPGRLERQDCLEQLEWQARRARPGAQAPRD